MKVTETIYHSSHYNSRTEDIEPTWEGFVSFAMKSPYIGAETPEGLARNRFFAEAFANLLALGTASWGWSDYHVEK